MERADNVGRVGHLVRLVGRGERHQHFALAHRHVHRPEIEEGMPEGEHTLAVVVGHGAEAGDGQIAIHQHAGHGVARIERVFPAGRRLAAAKIAARASLRHVDAHLAEQRAELAQSVVGETGKRERRLDRLHHGHFGRQTAAHCARGHQLAQQLARHRSLVATRRRLGRRARIVGPRLVEVLDFQHRLNRRDAAYRIRRKHAQPQRDGAHQLAIDVDRAAAHPRGDVGAQRLAAHLGDDDILLRPPHILPAADDFDGDRFRLGSLEHGPGHALHARLHLVERQNFHLAGFGARQWRIGGEERKRSNREPQKNRGRVQFHVNRGLQLFQLYYGGRSGPPERVRGSLCPAPPCCRFRLLVTVRPRTMLQRM